MVVPTFHPTPNVKKGVEYWQGVPATVDGVLGGYGAGTLPIVDAQGSRTFLLEMLPALQAIAPASASSSTTTTETWLAQRIAARQGAGRARTRALDCGAGVGRVTRDVLSRLIDIVHIVEPVDTFLAEAKLKSPSFPSMQTPPSKTAFKARKAIHFHQSTLQDFDPAKPYSTSTSVHPPTLSVADEAKDDGGDVGAQEALSQAEPIEYDVIWAQWCFQHLSDKDLLSFLERSKACLRKPSSSSATAVKDASAPDSSTCVLDGAGVIVIKENVLRDMEDGSERVWYDEEDHSITRTPNIYERVFRQANLEVVKTDVQRGLPEELFPVQIWCLRIPTSTADL